MRRLINKNNIDTVDAVVTTDIGPWSDTVWVEDEMREPVPMISPLSAFLGMPDGLFPIFVVSDVAGKFGAALFFRPDVQEKVRDVFLKKGMHGDIMVLPSSVHEVLVLPVGEISVSAAISMVRDINRTEVAPEDRLSDNVLVLHKDGTYEEYAA